MRTRFALATVVGCIAVLAIAVPAQASTCTYLNGAIAVYMPGSPDGVSLHRVGKAIYNGGQWCGGTVDNTSIITVNDTTPNQNGNDLVAIDLSGGPLAPEPGTGNEEAGGGVSEIEIYLFTHQGDNKVLVTGSNGNDNIHAGMAFESGVNARAINLNAGAEQGKVSDADVIYQEGNNLNPAATEPILFDGGEGDDTFDASGGAGFNNATMQPLILVGGNGNDHLVGGGSGDTLHADPGNDVLVGGQDFDTVTYQSSPGPANVNLSRADPQDTGAFGTDQFAGVELLTGSGYDDVLTGSDITNLIQGGGGNDVLTGRGGDDNLDGGPGSDTASYHETPAGATQGVAVDLGLAGSLQNTRAAGSDILNGIENLGGSPFADELIGDDHPNTITGWEGEDSVQGKGGDDHFEVRDGTRDLVTCGLGIDTVEADVQPIDSIFGDCETSVFAPYVPPGGGASGGSAGGATGTASGGATAPAKASFAGTKSPIRVDRRGRFRFTFHAGAGLTGKAAFRRTTKRRILLAQKAFTAPASGQVTLKMKLSRRSLRILKLNRQIRTRVTVTLKNASGLTSTASKLITLKASKRSA